MRRQSRSALLLLLFCQLPAAGRAQSLGFLDGRDEGVKIEYTAPGGATCREQRAPRPTLSLGAGVSGAQVLQGAVVSGDTPLVVPSRLSAPNLFAGVALRIPLGFAARSSCDRIIESDRRNTNYNLAKQLFEQGAIDKAQLQAVIDRLYAELLK